MIKTAEKVTNFVPLKQNYLFRFRFRSGLKPKPKPKKTQTPKNQNPNPKTQTQKPKETKFQTQKLLGFWGKTSDYSTQKLFSSTNF